MKSGTHDPYCAKASDHSKDCTCSLKENYQKHQKIVMRPPNAVDAALQTSGFNLVISTIGFGDLYKQLRELSRDQRIAPESFLGELFDSMDAVLKRMRGES